MLLRLILLTILTARVVKAGAGPLEEVLEHGPLFDELEDEQWWSGVDMIDTALRSHFELSEGEDDYCLQDESDCSSLAGSAAAVDHLRLPPPPPVPPTLTELVKQLNLLPSTDNGVGQQCILCQWASLNGTIDDLIPNSELSSEDTWVPMLVVVALVSAMLGAVLMITALKCRRLKVLPRGGSCPTLPVGYMVGEGKDGVVQTSGMSSSASELIETTLPKSTYHPTGLDHLSRPRLGTPTLHGPLGEGSVQHMKLNSQSTGWRVKLWRKMTGGGSSKAETSDFASTDQSDAISAVYAELNSVSGSVHHHHPIYHLNTYSEIREPCRMSMPPPPTAPGGLHLRRLLGDGTYENAGYDHHRVAGGAIIHLMEHDALSSAGCSASTPSSAYYSDLSDRSGTQHPQLMTQQPWTVMRPRVGSESQHSSHSLPPQQHCCGHHHHLVHHHHHHPHSRTLLTHHHARDLMPVTLQVVPDNQQYPSSCEAHRHEQQQQTGQDSLFQRGGVSASLNGSNKRPLPPLPSRQQQRPQRRYAYAVEAADGGSVSGGDVTPPLTCVAVPSEYV